MSKADTLLKKATSFERLALYSDRKAFLQALAQDAGFGLEPVKQYLNLDEFGKPKAQGLPPVPAVPVTPGAPAAKPYDMPVTNITGKYPTVRKEQQEALSRVNSYEGIGNPITVDGILGPETVNACQLFKKKFDPTNKYNLTNQKILDWAEMLADEPKYKLMGPQTTPPHKEMNMDEIDNEFNKMKFDPTNKYKT
jgi:hypothetical protein